MAYNVDVYKGCIKLGAGSMTNGSRSLSTYSGTAPVSGRNVQVVATGGNNIGATVATKVVTDGGATLTLFDAGTFS